MRRIPLVALCCVSCVAVSASLAAERTAAPASTQDREAVARLIDDSIGWFKSKDFDRLFAIFPEDPNLFLFQPNSTQTVVGGKAFRDGTAQWRDPDNFYLRHEIRDLRINISESGTVAWWSAVLDDCGSYGGRELCWKDCRWTGVAEKRQGTWVVAQAHFSFAADQLDDAGADREKAAAESYPDYASMRARVGELFAKGQYSSAATILKNHLDRLPENAVANTYNLSLTALMQGREEETIYWLEEGLRRGVFFNIWAFEGDNWKPVAGHPRFQVLVEHNRELARAAQAKAEMKLEVVTPEGYDSSKRYPLFIALHGGGENLETFKPRWTSPRLRSEFVVAYVQSSQVASMDGYHWQDDAIAARELRRAFDEVKGRASVDPEQVYIGGFSSGGYGSVQAVLNGVVPARGFVLLCPELPADPSDEQLEPLVRKRVRGTILTSELDRRIERQKEFGAFLTARQVPVRIVVIPNAGHWYPDDLPRLIDEALAFLFD